MCISRSKILAIAALAALCTSGNPTMAATFNWNGSGATPNWDDSSGGMFSNWGGTPALPGQGDTAIFGSGFSSGNPFLNGSRSVGTLGVDSSASFSIGGAPGTALTIAAGSVFRSATSTGAQSVNADIVLGGSGTWNIAGSGQLSVGRITESSTGTGFTKTGDGLLVLTNGGTLGGNTTVAEGTLRLAQSGTFPPTSTFSFGGMTVKSGAKLELNEPSWLKTSGVLEVETGATVTNMGIFVEIGKLSGGGRYEGYSRVGYDNSSSTFTGILADSPAGRGTLAKFGAGTFTLTQAPQITGNIDASEGALVLLAGVPSAGPGSERYVGTGSSGTIYAQGVIDREFGNSGTLVAIGDLTVGRFQTNGFSGPGFLNVGSHSVTLVSNGSEQRNVLLADGGQLSTGSSSLRMRSNGSFTSLGDGTFTGHSFESNGRIVGPSNIGDRLTLRTSVVTRLNTGSISGAVSFAGTGRVELTDSVGSISTAVGSLEFIEDSRLSFELGNPSTNNFDRLAITGAVDFPAVIEVRRLVNYKMYPGQSFAVMSFGSSSGVPTAINETPYSLAFDVSMTSTTLTLHPRGFGGDANLDGIVNITDFATLAARFNQPGTWLEGDFNLSGTVDIADFSILSSHFNRVAVLPRAATVPEPAALAALLVVGSMLGASRAWRHDLQLRPIVDA